MKVLNYKPINNAGALKGSFDLVLVLDKTNELTIHECKIFEKNGRWIGFPSRQYQKDNETKYAPFVSMQKELKSKIEAECLRQLGPLVLATSDPVKASSVTDDVPF